MLATNVYVDGFNLYYGGVQGTPYKWLNIRAMLEDVLAPKNLVQHVHYCTAMVHDTPDDVSKASRQQTFIRALETLPEFTVTYGSFMTHPKRFPLAPPRDERDLNEATVIHAENAGAFESAVVLRTEEKGSDVNLATLLVADAFNGRFEAAAVLSNDTDLVLPIKVVTEELGLPVGILNPRKGFHPELRKVASFRRHIHKRFIRDNQFPNVVIDAEGREITKPEAWNQ